MKIEKLTETKIRIILKKEDFKNKNFDFKKLLMLNYESQDLFLEILAKAKNEINFNTEGYTLLIETYSQDTDTYIFIITKYKKGLNINPQKEKDKKNIYAKNKHNQKNTSYYICQFNNLDDFFDFCNYINTFKLNKAFKTSILYFYNNTYYLVINDINKNHELAKLLYLSILEFSSNLTFNKNFIYKLFEHGKLLIKNNAINKTLNN